MELNLEYQRTYETMPSVAVAAVNRETGARMEFRALVDTGADGTLLDLEIAETLGLDLQEGRPIEISGIGGAVSTAREVVIDIELLSQHSLRSTIWATFAPGVATVYGNLLGVNVLEDFDLAVSHSRRVIYLGKSPP